MESMRQRLLALITLVILLAGPAWAEPESWVGRNIRVSAPVADVRKEPAPASVGRDYDPLEETQLLYGDTVQVAEEKGDWVRLFAAEQLEWNHHNRWEGYPGWTERSALALEPEEWNPNFVVTAKWAFVRANPEPAAPALLKLSIGTRLQALPRDPSRNDLGPIQGWWKIRLLDGSAGWIAQKEGLLLETLDDLRDDSAGYRKRIVETARIFLGDPYYWGGRSADDPESKGPPNTGVDCSGLVGLVYQANNSIIPRDAHEQWMNSRKIERDQLQPGDLVFLGDPNKPEQISHVMLYVGDGRVIEGAGTGGTVREIALEERLKENPQRRVAYGRYLP